MNLDNYYLAEMLKDNGMVSNEQGMNIYHLLVQTLLLDIPGEVAEFGCHIGSTAIFIQKILDQYGSVKQLHLYDGFEGLPAKNRKDGGTPFVEKSLSWHGWKGKDQPISPEIVNEHFKDYGLKLPIIHPAWFNQLKDEDLPAQISFAHIDGDFYTSTLDALRVCYPKLSKGAVCVIDDYTNPYVTAHIHSLLQGRAGGPNSGVNLFPGVKNACDEFFADKPEKVGILYSGYQPHGYFRKI